MAPAAADRYPCGRTDREKTMHEPMPSRTLALSRRSLLSAGGLLLAAWGMPAMAGPTRAMVYKNPWCGCCIGWVEHLEANGFAVTVEDSDDLAPVKARLGVPAHLESCHTAVIEGYTIEGHVPAVAIEKLLATRPALTGLAVPGMPMGSPGMEGATSEAYDVIAFGPDGESVFLHIPA